MSVTKLSHLWMRSTLWRLTGCALQSSTPCWMHSSGQLSMQLLAVGVLTPAVPEDKVAQL